MRHAEQINTTKKVEGGQDKGLQVSGKLPEARCRFVLPGTRGGGGNANNSATTTAGAAAASGGATSAAAGGGAGGSSGDNKGASTAVNAGGGGGGGSVLDFGRASVGVEVVRTVTLQNTGKSPAVFFVDTADLKLVSWGFPVDVDG